MLMLDFDYDSEVCWHVLFVFFFFFKQKTAYEIYQCDWSSDVCSSDLSAAEERSSCPASNTSPATQPPVCACKVWASASSNVCPA